MDPQLQQKLMLFGGFIPGGLAFAGLLIGWYIHAFRESRTDLDDKDERRTPSPGPRWLLPILITLGVAGSEYAINSKLFLWPDDNTYRYTHAIALIALVGVAEGLVVLPLFAAFIMRLLAYGGAFWMLSEGFTDTVLGGSTNLIAYTLFAGLATALVATGAERNTTHNHHERRLGWLDAITWVLIIGAMMPVLFANHFATGAMIPGGVIAVLSSTIIVGLIFRSLSIARGGITVLCGFVMMLLVGSFVQVGADNLPSVLLISILPLVTLIPLHTPSRIKRLMARVALVAIVGGTGVLFAMGPKLDAWPGGNNGDGSGDDQSLEDYYNSLDE
jgi:hypothetical protein